MTPLFKNETLVLPWGRGRPSEVYQGWSGNQLSRKLVAVFD